MVGLEDADNLDLLQLWTDAKSRELIATEYPWFLSTFDNYTHPIQRADAIRYFVLAHYGGVYIDLDDVSGSPSKSDIQIRPILTSVLFSNRAAIVASTHFSLTQRGFAAHIPRESPTMRWAPFHTTPSSPS